MESLPTLQIGSAPIKSKTTGTVLDLMLLIGHLLCREGEAGSVVVMSLYGGLGRISINTSTVDIQEHYDHIIMSTLFSLFGLSSIITHCIL